MNDRIRVLGTLLILWCVLMTIIGVLSIVAVLTK